MHIHRLLNEQQTQLPMDAMGTEQGTGLFRGTTNRVVNDGEYAELPIRQNRRPRDADGYESILFNYAIDKTHNIGEIRKRALFCTTDINVAFEYHAGGPYIGQILEVFPKKGTKFLFDPRVSDSAAIMERLVMDISAHDGDEHVKSVVSMIRRHANEYMNFNSTQIVLKAFDSLPSPHNTRVKELIDNVVTRAVGGYKVVDDISHLKNAVDAEVMLFDAQTYYARTVDTGQPDWD